MAVEGRPRRVQRTKRSKHVPSGEFNTQRAPGIERMATQTVTGEEVDPVVTATEVNNMMAAFGYAPTMAKPTAEKMASVRDVVLAKFNPPVDEKDAEAIMKKFSDERLSSANNGGDLDDEYDPKAPIQRLDF